MIKIVDDLNIKGDELRKVIANTIIELSKDDSKIIALEADLGAASYFNEISRVRPENFLQCGISEANMIGVASGLSLLGFKPLVHSFAPFITRRCFDQIYMSAAYSKNNVNIYGSDPGYMAAANGGTHTSYEDIALIGSIPNSIICDGTDAILTEFIIREFMKRDGVNYLRANRKAAYNIYDKESTFEMGKANLLREGSDILIISSGELVRDCLIASEKLKELGISVCILDMFTIKPIDKAAIIKYAEGKKIVLTYENHNVENGLGSRVANVLSENSKMPRLVRIGVDNRFGQVGPVDYLKKEYGFTVENIVNHIIKEIK